jgi:hypothetical protein
MVRGVDPEHGKAVVVENLVRPTRGGEDPYLPTVAEGVGEMGDNHLAAAAIVEGVCEQEEARAAAHRGTILRHWT